MNFDTTYYNALSSIQPLHEGKFKSLATAGLMATAVANGATAGNAPRTTNPAIIQTSSARQPHSNEDIVRYIRNFTKNAEASGGAKLTAYICPTGHLTIGYGTNIESSHNASYLKQLGYDVNLVRNKQQKISQADADKLLDFGLSVAVEDAKKFLPNFDEQPMIVKGIIVDMAYNLGFIKLNGNDTIRGFRNMRQALMNKDYVQASKEMINSKWFKQVGNRSIKLVKMMRGVR